MELWVISQDKEILANVKSVRFCIMKKCELKAEPSTMAEFAECADAYCVECNGEFFGEYPTKERCLEIIDEIQWFLANNGSTEDRILAKVIGIQNNFIVYEMPKE